MSRDEWQVRIKSACNEAKTYRPFFDAVIETLADMMEKRDEVQEAYERLGDGAEQDQKNRLIRMLNGINDKALAYWRDLGLTPAGLKRLNEAALAPKKEGSALEEALAKLGG